MCVCALASMIVCLSLYEWEIEWRAFKTEPNPVDILTVNPKHSKTSQGNIEVWNSDVVLFKLEEWDILNIAIDN